MNFDLDRAIEILNRTPSILNSLLSNLSEEWVLNNEGENTWSPYDVMGHLIHGEQTDWMPRIRIILSDEDDKTFVAFDRFAQFKNDQSVSIEHLLQEFESLRNSNIKELISFNLSDADLYKTGIHPDLGIATLRELLSTWTVHDLSHLSQISRVMAKQYADQVGPWSAYLKILQ